MKAVFFRPILFTAILLIAAMPYFGQIAGKGDDVTGKLFDRETITFEGKVSKLKVSITIAEITLTANAKPNSNDLLIKAVAVSKGTMLKLFRYSFGQDYESTVDLANFNIKKTTKHDVQKDRVRDSEALFDYKEKLVTYVETDPKDKMRPPRRIASEISDPMNDMVTGIYALRLQTLTVGKKFNLKVSDSGLVFDVPVVVTAREQQKTSIGNLWCFRVEPEIFGKNRLIEQKGKMVLWITDDPRHLPVRAQVESEYGKIDIRIKSTAKGG